MSTTEATPPSASDTNEQLIGRADLNDIEAILSVTNTDVNEALRAVQDHADAIFTWDYEKGRRPALNKLYEKAKHAQWNGETDLDWSIEVDQERHGGGYRGAQPVQEPAVQPLVGTQSAGDGDGFQTQRAPHGEWRGADRDAAVGEGDDAQTARSAGLRGRQRRPARHVAGQRVPVEHLGAGPQARQVSVELHGDSADHGDRLEHAERRIGSRPGPRRRTSGGRHVRDGGGRRRKRRGPSARSALRRLGPQSCPRRHRSAGERRRR